MKIAKVEEELQKNLGELISRMPPCDRLNQYIKIGLYLQESSISKISINNVSARMLTFVASGKRKNSKVLANLRKKSNPMNIKRKNHEQ